MIAPLIDTAEFDSNPTVKEAERLIAYDSSSDEESRKKNWRMAERRARILPEIYKNPVAFIAGTQRVIGEVEWGNSGRTWKTDIPLPRDKKSKEKKEAGFGTEKEFRLLQRIKDAYLHGIDAPLEIHSGIDEETGERFVVAVHKLMEGRQSLEGRVKENGPLGFQEFRKLFPQYLKRSVRTYRQAKIFQRDPNPENILIEKNSANIWASDFGHGIIEGEDNRERVLSLGGRATDWRLFSREKYCEKHEVGGLAISALYAITGKYAVKVDPYNRKARRLDNGESILNDSGRIDIEKLKAAYEDLFANIRGDSKRLIPVFRKALGLENSDKNKEYGLEDFISDIDRAVKPTLFEKARKHWKGLAAALLIGSASVVGLSYSAHQQNEKQKSELERLAEESKKLPVEASFSGSDLEFKNGLVNLDFTVKTWKPFEMLYDTESNGKRRDEHNNVNCVRLEKNKEYEITPCLRQISNTQLSLPTFSGRVYIEGWPAKGFYTTSLIRDTTQYEEYYPYPSDIKFKLPEDIPEGAYKLTMEIDTPALEDAPNNKTALSEVRFKNPGRIICRKSIDIVVGNPQLEIAADSLRVGGYSQFCTLRSINYSNESGSGCTGQIEIPAIGYSTVLSNSNPRNSQISDSLRFPDTKNPFEDALTVTVKHGDKPVGFSGFPIARTLETFSNGYTNRDWRALPPSTNFSEKLVEYRKNAFKMK